MIRVAMASTELGVYLQILLTFCTLQEKLLMGKQCDMNKNLLNVLRKRKCVANTFLKNRVETNWIYYNKQPRAF